MPYSIFRWLNEENDNKVYKLKDPSNDTNQNDDTTSTEFTTSPSNQSVNSSIEIPGANSPNSSIEILNKSKEKTRIKHQKSRSSIIISDNNKNVFFNSNINNINNLFEKQKEMKESKDTIENPSLTLTAENLKYYSQIKIETKDSSLVNTNNPNPTVNTNNPNPTEDSRKPCTKEEMNRRWYLMKITSENMKKNKTYGIIGTKNNNNNHKKK